MRNFKPFALLSVLLLPSFLLTAGPVHSEAPAPVVDDQICFPLIGCFNI